MDLYSMYLPDALSYTSFRSPAYYRDYETQPFDNKKKSCNYKERQQVTVSAQVQHNHGGSLHAISKQQRRESCPFCKEDKRRPLGVYLRSKGTADHKDSITEEEQDQDQEEGVLEIVPSDEAEEDEVPKQSKKE